MGSPYYVPWGTLERGCPRCGGDLEWWHLYFGCEPLSGGVRCRTCRYKTDEPLSREYVESFQPPPPRSDRRSRYHRLMEPQ